MDKGPHIKVPKCIIMSQTLTLETEWSTLGPEPRRACDCEPRRRRIAIASRHSSGQMQLWTAIDRPATNRFSYAVKEITIGMQRLIQASRFKGFYRGAAVRPSDLWPTLRLFGPKGWTVAGVGAIGAFLAMGVPSAMIDNPFFIRMIPVRVEDYVISIVTSILLGLVLGTFAISSVKGDGGKALGSGILTYLAVGCPVCNKLVILFLGISGALAYFEPVQIYLGIGSVMLLGWTLLLRARSVTGVCPA